MSARRNPWRWCRKNLFATPFDTALSLIFVPLCIWAIAALGVWALTQAEWRVITENLRVMMVGTYPVELMLRPWICTFILAFLAGATLGTVVTPARKRTLIALAAALAMSLAFGMAGHMTPSLAAACIAVGLAVWLAAGTYPALLRRATPLAWFAGLIAIGALLSASGVERWGGLLMSVVFTLLAAVLSVPLGIGLALGRRSRHASARIICTGYIELMRSLPLILIVYWIWIITPLVAPDHPVPDLARGLVGFGLFFAAYVAEYVRSGLQGVPRGQVEAAQSLGMSPGHVSRDIVLPQAVRVVMPALVGNVLDIFNNVPLLFIIGMTDFLRAGQMVLINPQSGGRTYEIYVFMFAVYLAVASLITFGARCLETRMAIGHR